MTAAEFVSRLGADAKPTRTGSGWQCRCPAHEDRTASLSVADSADRVLLHCHAGCKPEAVCAATGLKLADLFSGRTTTKRNAGKIVATYDYTDENGKLLYQVVRFEPKDFRQRKPDTTALGGWTWSTKNTRRVLYRLPEILRDVKRNRPIIIAEGEKDVDNLVRLGFSATCNPGGAGKWLHDYSAVLRGAVVFVIADRDEPGRRHAQDVAGSLHRVASRVSVLELPDRSGRVVKDASDFAAAGADAGEIAACLDAAPEWTAGASLTDQDQPQAQPIGTLTAPEPDGANELLKRRYLCRGAGLLLVGQSGQGKSSLALQMSVLWALGRPCFGVQPTRPLRVLLIEGENDDGDLYEMFSGICSGLQLSDADKKLAGESIVFCHEDARAGDDFLALTVTPLVRRYRPDLLILDPALAYIPGDTKDAQAVGQFLRRELNPILHKWGCATLLVHHTTKAKADGPRITADFLYAGAGSIEFTNWARAVLALETRGNGCYRLHAPKRGGRIGWKDADGQPVFDTFIRHSRMPGAIFWEPLDEGEVESAARTGKSKADLLAHVPVEGSIPQSVLLEKANAAGIGQKKARSFLDELIEDGKVHLWLVKRKGTNPEKRVSRHPQPEVAPQPA